MEKTLRVGVGGKSFQVVPGRYDAFWEQVSRGAWEADTFAIFERFLDRQHSYIDIGSWIGPTLLYGCQLAKSAYGIEPDPLAHDELAQNVASNKPLTDNVRLFNVCIAPQSGKVALGNHSEGGNSESSLLFSRSKTSWLVEGLSFEDFIRRNGINDCNFIKIDIEGGEYSVLPTMAVYLKKYRPTVHLSLHPAFLGERVRSGLAGKASRGAHRFANTLKIIRSLKFYKHFYDRCGKHLSSSDLLWICRQTTFFDVVVTDLEWHEATRSR